jgi:hypothetical protein
LLILFLVSVGFLGWKHEKAHRLGGRRAWYLLDLDGRLVQAMAVRRHGEPMMMMMAGMAVALHLFSK